MRLANPKQKSLKKFLKIFKNGFYDQKYLDWERNYKWTAHESWEKQLNKKEFTKLLKAREYKQIAKRAVNIESRTNLLFSFEKMALRDGVKSEKGAEIFAKGLYDHLYGKEPLEIRFLKFAEALKRLPIRQTRVLTWPVLTVFGFIADPTKYVFLKPVVTKTAAEIYNFNFEYSSKPNWNTYSSLISFAKQIKNDLPQLKSRDLIDLQSFIWVLGSAEYD